MTSFIAISGNLGSGKSTLARGLSNYFNWKVFPERPVTAGYVTDQFQNPERWSFEAQMSFLFHKADSIARAYSQESNFIVDRSIYEDVSVFARLFREADKMDKRAHDTYLNMASILIATLPGPLLILHCDCPPAICEERLKHRPRVYQSLYPPGHLDRLDQLYKEWISSFDSCPILRVDTAIHDTRLQRVVETVARSLRQYVSFQDNEKAVQLEIFEDDPEPPPALSVEGVGRSSILHQINDVVWAGAATVSMRQSRKLTIPVPPPPVVYIAAPFTSFATEEPTSALTRKSPSQTAFEIAPEHGQIPRGEYRRVLRGISRAFESIGYNSILPHEYVNRWGARQLTAKQVGEYCVQLVEESDLFFGILGTSFGTHIEAGVALARRKPCILVHVKDLNESFMAGAVRESRRATAISVQRLDDLPSLIRSGEFLGTIDRAARQATENRTIGGGE